MKRINKIIDSFKPSVSCNVCGLTLNTDKELTEHLKEKHGIAFYDNVNKSITKSHG